MATILVPPDIAERMRTFLDGLTASHGLEVITPPLESGVVLPPETLERIDAAFFNVASGPLASRKLLGTALRAPNLRWMHLGHSGADDPAFQVLMDRGVAFTNSAGVQAEPIAQSAIAGLLALNRGIPGWLEAQRRRAWEPSPKDLPNDELPPELRGQTMVVLGLGAIGSWVARYAQPYGMHIVGVRRTPAGVEDGVDEWVHPEALASVLPRADVLVITLPLTAQTDGLLDASVLDLLPPGAVVVNVSRGQVVDEAALAERLASGRIAGAYLDVFEEEPLPEDAPLWGLPNAILSPHEAGRSAGSQPRIDAIFREELERWLRGEESPRLVRER